MPRHSGKHHSSRTSSHANGGSSSKRQRHSPKLKRSKGGRGGMSSGSSNLEELKKRVDPRLLDGKTSEDFRTPYLKNLEEANQLQQGLNNSRQRLDRLDQKRYDLEMEKVIYPLIDPEITSNTARDDRSSRDGEKKKH